jgi:membrane protease YdiL (CAAX protease family)
LSRAAGTAQCASVSRTPLPLVPFWNADERRLRAPFRIALQIAMLAAASPVLARVGREVEEARVAHLEGTFAYASFPLVGAFVVLFTVWLASRFLDRRSLEHLGLFGDRAFWIDTAFGFVLGGLLMGGILGAELAFGWARYASAPELGEAPRLTYVPVVFLAFVAVGFYEELLFRGYYLTNLAEGLESRFLRGPVAVLAATFLSSIAFGVMHAGNPQATAISTTNIMLAGLMLAVGYVATGRLAIPIGLHLAWNFFQNLFGMPVSGLTHLFPGALFLREPTGPAWITGGAFGPEAGATGVVAMTVGTLLILVWVRVRHGRLGIASSIASPPPLVRAGRVRAPLPAAEESPA